MGIGRPFNNGNWKPKTRGGLRVKVTALICLSILVVTLIGSAIEYSWMISTMNKAARESQLKIAEIVAAFIADMIDEQIEQVKVFSARPLVQKAVEESNLRYGQMSREVIKRYFVNMDAEWISAPDGSPLVKEYVDSEISRKHLMPEIKENDELVEIFITDKFGGLVASSGKTSDFYQADERWWQAASEGNVFVGDVELDESSNALGVTIAAPIMDNGRKVIGICKAVFDAQKLFSSLNKFKLGTTGHAILVNDKGMIIFYKDVKPLSVKLINGDMLDRVLNKNSSFEVIGGQGLRRADTLTTFKIVEHSVLSKNNIEWFVAINQEVKEVFAPLNDLATAMFIFFGAAILTMIPVGFIFGGSIVRPIKKIVEGASEIGKGNLDYKIYVETNDEVEDMSEALNSMATNLKSKTTSIDLLNKEIANRMKAEEAIANAAREWRKTFDSITDMVFIQDTEFTIIRANKAFASAMKMRPQDIVGKKCYEAIPHKGSKPELNCPFEKTRMDMQTHTAEIYNQLTGIPFLVTTSPIFDKDGKLVGSVHIAKDISEMKKARDELERKNAELQKVNKLKSDFISTVSHELRTPLSIIKEGISLVLDNVPGEINEKQGHILTTAKENIDRLARVIDSLLDIAKIESGKVSLNKTKFSIKDLAVKIAYTFVPIAREKGIEIEVTIPDEDVFVCADVDRITEVLINLIGNAVKFTEKGSVDVSVEDRPDTAACSITDTGVGISAEDLPKVFEKFQQFGRVAGPGEKGTGLGLSISKNIIDLHKGKLSVESELGKGSKFTFILPKS